MLGEFKEFLRQHNVVGLAIAVVIGGAVGKLVTALVTDLVMPIIGAVTPTGNWREAVLTIGNIHLGIGDFIGAFIDFVIIATVIFIIVKNVLKEEPVKK